MNSADPSSSGHEAPNDIRVMMNWALDDDDASRAAEGPTEIISSDTTSRAVRPAADKAGTVIGPFTLVKPLGHGGFGEVWQAEQLKPIRRTVALKLIKPGMASDDVLQRFDTERKALAMMDHPNIARVFDAGATPDGRPWFAMELVDGAALTTYCDRKRLTIRQRLDLFIKVCAAVQHAHQKAVLHRDLKPSNIIVSEVDGYPVPKVIDFGIAKALGTSPELMTRELFARTREGSFIGTPQYMSPEQAGATPDLDTRSDIYTLGIILYELLTGDTPLVHGCATTTPVFEILRQIREVEPARPSSRIALVTASVTRVATSRRTDPAKLSQQIKRDLDWIVLKALEKERGRRYASASDLAQDIARHLNDEPVSASPPSTFYRVRKMVRRNKAAVLGSAAVVSALIVGLCASLWQARIAASEQERADREAANALSVQEFLQQDLLQQASVTETTDRSFLTRPNLTIKEALMRAATKIENRFGGSPEVEASIRLTFGAAFVNYGDPAAAIPQLRRALELHTRKQGPEHRDTLLAMSHLATACRVAGEYDEAIEIATMVLNIRKRLLPTDHPGNLEAIENLASAYRSAGKAELALPLYEESLQRKKALFGEHDSATLQTMNNLAAALMDLARSAQAVIMLEEIHTAYLQKKEAENPNMLLAMDNLAAAYVRSGKTTEALNLGTEVFQKMKTIMGPDHVHTLRAQRRLADSHITAGKPADAVSLFQDLLKRVESVLGPDSHDTKLVADSLRAARILAGQQMNAAANSTISRNSTNKFSPQVKDGSPAMQNFNPSEPAQVDGSASTIPPPSEINAPLKSGSVALGGATFVIPRTANRMTFNPRTGSWSGSAPPGANARDLEKSLKSDRKIPMDAKVTIENGRVFIQ